MQGEVGGCGVSANENSCAHGAQINFRDITPDDVGGGSESSHFFGFTVELIIGPFKTFRLICIYAPPPPARNYEVQITPILS
jgi:hypothetical protein